MGKLKARNPFLLLAVLTTVAPPVHAKVMPTDLKKLTRHSDAIAVARVYQVTTIGGVKVARATVLRSLTGMHANQQFAFIAQPTWSCDGSTAVQDETVLIFLSQPILDSYFLKAHRQFPSARASQL